MRYINPIRIQFFASSLLYLQDCTKVSFTLELKPLKVNALKAFKNNIIYVLLFLSSDMLIVFSSFL